MSPALAAAIADLAVTPRLLVASDYDGTLSELVDHPDDAVPHQPGLDALARLSMLPRTTVALVSGRTRAELGALSGLGDPVVFIGSHGAERPGVEVGGHTLADELLDEVRAITAGVPGSVIETRPTGVTFHYRTAADRRAVSAALRAIVDGPAARPGVRTVTGKDIIELSVSHETKGDALIDLRRATGATATLFVGDDLSDEDAFAVLRPGDVGIKVGESATMAEFRVPDVATVALVLHELASRRAHR